jgi:hypothetical protein
MTVRILKEAQCDICRAHTINADAAGGNEESDVVAYVQTKGWTVYAAYGSPPVDMISCPHCEARYGVDGTNDLAARLVDRHAEQTS